jgi:hypothetical protein
MGAIEMKRLMFAAMLGTTAAVAVNPAFADSVGTKVLTLSNVSYSCINVQKELVDFWILSARIPKNNSFWAATKGVGARVDVQLSSANSGSHFPAAAAIRITDLNGKVIRAYLSLHVLDQNNLWDVTSDPQTKTTSFNAPLTYIRRQGASDTVKIMQALISFTSSASSVVPANPYSKGAQLVGQFFTSLNTIFQPDPKEQYDPDFQLSFGLGRTDSGCNDLQLRAGVGAEIADHEGSEADGIIKTAKISDYCFYKLGDDQDRDPDIGFVKKQDTICASEVPSNVTTLNNPQFIWMASSSCKEEKSCGLAPPVTPQHLALFNGKDSTIIQALTTRLPSVKIADTTKVTRAMEEADPGLLKHVSKSVAHLVHGLALCRSVGIAADRCFDHRFAVGEPD